MTIELAARPLQLRIVPCTECRADLYEGERSCPECGSDNAHRVRFCRECGGGQTLDLSGTPGLALASCVGVALGVAASLWGLLGAATVPVGMAVLAVHALLSPRLRCRRCDGCVPARAHALSRAERSEWLARSTRCIAAGAALGLLAFAML